MRVRAAGPGDLAHLEAGLRALAEVLGDDYLASPEALSAACFGPAPVAGAVLAIDGDVAGMALFSGAFSTILGGAGVVVSDLWVAETHRGAGLGRAMLAEAAREGARRWGAVYLRLSYSTGNPKAKAFYMRLGFATREDDRNAILAGDRYRQLAGVPE